MAKIIINYSGLIIAITTWCTTYYINFKVIMYCLMVILAVAEKSQKIINSYILKDFSTSLHSARNDGILINRYGGIF